MTTRTREQITRELAFVNQQLSAADAADDKPRFAELMQRQDALIRELWPHLPGAEHYCKGPHCFCQ